MRNTLTYEKSSSLYVWRGDFESRLKPKNAGFRWDPGAKRWHTSDARDAASLRQYADEAAEIRIVADLGETVRPAAPDASRAVDSDVDIPCPEGLAYLPYQKAGIAYALARTDALCADEMGLGKTVQAIGVLNGDPSISTMLVICPASLKSNWRREIEKWSIKPVKVGIATGSRAFPDESHNVVIVNYEIVKKFRSQIDARSWGLLVCDESHYLKNGDAARTRAVLGGRTSRPIQAQRRLFLTGTPILNRPADLWTTVRALDPAGLGADFNAFHTRYCDLHETAYGTDVSGASHLKELQERLRASIMVRRTKAQVLPDLPAKIRQVVVLDPDRVVAATIASQASLHDRTEAAKARIAALKAQKNDDFDAEVTRLTGDVQAGLAELALLRHAIAMAKIPHAIGHIEESLAGGSEKIVVFAHHRDVVAALVAHFKTAAVAISGDTPTETRQGLVDRFQDDPAIRVFVGNIRAAGVGLTLTAASHVVMAELDWTPAAVSQAEDRCHRIGQKDSVLVQHLVFDGSLDAHMAQMVMEKQRIIDAAVGGGTIEPTSAPAPAPAPERDPDYVPF